MKNQVIRIPEITNQSERGEKVKFTHVFEGENGWEEENIYKPSDANKVVFLGECSVDGDMFAAYTNNNTILIFKGHLNSGKY
jgi:hypothetical protein